MRKLNLLVVILLSLTVLSPAVLASKNCGVVTIRTILTGPSHGAMMRVTGSCSWVCLDPDGEHMSINESQRLFTHVMSMYLHNKPIQLYVLDGTYSQACGGNYHVAYDVRAPGT